MLPVVAKGTEYGGFLHIRACRPAGTPWNRELRWPTCRNPVRESWYGLTRLPRIGDRTLSDRQDRASTDYQTLDLQWDAAGGGLGAVFEDAAAGRYLAFGQ